MMNKEQKKAILNFIKFLKTNNCYLSWYNGQGSTFVISLYDAYESFNEFIEEIKMEG